MDIANNLGIIIGIVTSSVTLTYGVMQYFHSIAIKRFEDQFAQITTNLVTEDDERFFDVGGLLINREDTNKISDGYIPLQSNLIYFNSNFAGNNWTYENLSLEKYNAKYAPKSLASLPPDKYHLRIHHWKSNKKINSKLGQFESHILLEAVSRNQVEEIICSRQPNIGQKKKESEIEIYFKNYLYETMVNSFIEYGEMNLKENNPHKVRAKLIDNIAYIKGYVTQDDLIIFDDFIYITLEDYTVKITARILANDITDENSYLVKWINNLKIVKN